MNSADLSNDMILKEVMGIAYVKTTQARQLHCPCSFFRGSQQRLAIRLAGEGGLPLMAGSGRSHWSLLAPLPHPTIPLPPSQGTSAELCPMVVMFSLGNRISVLF